MKLTACVMLLITWSIFKALSVIPGVWCSDRISAHLRWFPPTSSLASCLSVHSFGCTSRVLHLLSVPQVYCRSAPFHQHNKVVTCMNLNPKTSCIIILWAKDSSTACRPWVWHICPKRWNSVGVTWGASFPTLLIGFISSVSWSFLSLVLAKGNGQMAVLLLIYWDEFHVPEKDALLTRKFFLCKQLS